MPTLNLGQVRPVYRGAWNSIDAYTAYDFVTYNGSAYLALKDIPANYEPPSQTEYWVLFGAKGDPGEPGLDGVDGAQGERGPSPGYRWNGTFLSIQNPDGTWPDQGVDLQGPAVPLSNGVTSTSETDAASSLAVKMAYDRGTSGLEAAAAAQGAANTAQSAANTAQNTANTALNTANTALNTANSKVSDLSTGNKVSLYWNANLGIPVWRTDVTDFELARYTHNATVIRCGNSQIAYAPAGGTWYCISLRVSTNSTNGSDVATWIVNNSICGFYSGGQQILTTGIGDGAVIFCTQVKK